MAEALGFTVTQETGKIYFRKDDKLVMSSVGAFDYQLQTDTSTIDLPLPMPIIAVNGHIMVPTTYIELFDFRSIEYDQGNESWNFETK